ncbi:hypothetical protein P280DRAFT_470449 [Massarina eburnea CBS 473.64]|uniref:Uncharacterized protein n=1 Tax=Massarina eburnea CBS 473.64 TaxID=1395130 RepID=A0A6A6RWW9_9PLEO|nr:hypothetical protein P280DRAFT_470449 [Massarina eburnea CBS 473.64]
MMHLATLLGTSLALSVITLAAPVSDTQMGSKHTVYLSTCTRRATVPDCPIVILCNQPAAPAQTYTAAAYFVNSRPQANLPTEVAVVSTSLEPWEGTQRVAKFRTATFSSVIDAGAKGLSKSDVAGSARLGNEDFACFKDGETVFAADGLTSCRADYWCASLDV